MFTALHFHPHLCVWRLRNIIKLPAPTDPETGSKFQVFVTSSTCDDSGRSSTQEWPTNTLVFIGHIIWLWEQHWCQCYTHQISYTITKLINPYITPLCYEFKPLGKCEVGFISILIGWIPTLACFSARLLVHLRFLQMLVGQTQNFRCFVACRPFTGVCLKPGYNIPGVWHQFPHSNCN